MCITALKSDSTPVRWADATPRIQARVGRLPGSSSQLLCCCRAGRVHRLAYWNCVLGATDRMETQAGKQPVLGPERRVESRRHLVDSITERCHRGRAGVGLLPDVLCGIAKRRETGQVPAFPCNPFYLWHVCWRSAGCLPLVQI